MGSDPSIDRSGAVRRAWYRAPIADFLRTDVETVLAHLVQSSGFDVLLTQRDAWVKQIVALREHLAGLDGSIFFEFSIPRMGKRIDVVALIGPAVFAIEFKVGASAFDRNAIEQVWDYALDLKNFHQDSHHLPIAPILVATEARTSHGFAPAVDPDGVYRPIHCGSSDLRRAIAAVLSSCHGDAIDAERWYD